MKYLREQFDQDLDEDGDIVIARQTFLRHDILDGLASEAYRIAFNEWMEQRKERLLEKANEILAQFDNRTRFDQLYAAFRGGSMIPFIGSGMSKPTGFPLWEGFLRSLCQESHVHPGELDALLGNADYEAAAELLHDDLGEALFDENIQSTFGREASPKGPLNYLPQLFPSSTALTTNFDGLIEAVYSGSGSNGFDRIVSGKAMGEVSRQMVSGVRLLVKMHGDCRQTKDRILLKREYEQAYGNDGEVELFFNQVMFGRSILFLGCSLTVDRTIGSMKKIVSKYGSARLPRHYAFLELKDSDDRVARKKELSKANIFPIWYGQDDHDESLEALFLKLLEE